MVFGRLASPNLWGFCSAYIAELWGIYQGLCVARNMGCTHLIVETDSVNIVKQV